MHMRRAVSCWKVMLLAIVLGPLANAGALATSWSYVDPANAANQILLDETARTAAIGDLADEAMFCGERDEMKCFRSRALRFAVPRRLDPSKTMHSWEHDGVKFTATRRSTPLMVLGQKLEIFSIETLNKKVRVRFLYSPVNGLVAIMTADKVGGPLFLLQETCGFGASPLCK
jgi:hypothetical protein